MYRRTLTGIALLSLALAAANCTGNGPDGPSAPSPATPSRSVPTPAVTAISPSVGTASGGTPITINGTGLLPGVTVTFDGATVTARFDTRYNDRIFLYAPAHAVGTTDVVVTNAGGRPGRLVAGYRFASPESFDFNGTWRGFPYDGSDYLLQFTILKNELLSVSCDSSTISFSDPVVITNGEFSFSRDGATMSGRIASGYQAVGTINVPPCNAPLWVAERSY
jgi:hypothetical protein